MSGLVQGGEVLTAIEASALRARDIGYDEALAELGFDAEQLRLACHKNGVAWLHQLSLTPSAGDVLALIAAANLEGLTAGIRLGRMYGPRPDQRLIGELALVVAELRNLASDHGAHVVAPALRDIADHLERAARDGV